MGRSCSPKYCGCLGLGSALLLSYPPWQTLPQCPGEGWRQFCKALIHQQVPRWQPRPKTSAWPLVVTEPAAARSWTQTWPHGHRPSTGQDHTMVPGDITGCLHQAVAYSRVVLPLFIVHTSFGFSFSSISPPPICSFWWGPRSLNIWDPLKSGLQNAMPC